jgi:hypothetical protein
MVSDVAATFIAVPARSLGQFPPWGLALFFFAWIAIAVFLVLRFMKKNR